MKSILDISFPERFGDKAGSEIVLHFSPPFKVSDGNHESLKAIIIEHS